MLIWRHREQSVPPELAGWSAREPFALCHYETDAWRYCAVADPIVAPQPPPDDEWSDTTGGWQIARVSPDDQDYQLAIARTSCWAKVLPVQDSRGISWLAPGILTALGERAYSVRYAGKGFMPRPSPEQAASEDCAREFRRLYTEAAESRSLELPIEIACTWAATMLAVTHHLSPESIGASGIIDDHLVLGVMKVAAGLHPKQREIVTVGHG